MENYRDEYEIDLREILHLLKKRVLIIILAAMVFAVGAGVYSFLIATPTYDATAKLYILTKSTSITSLADVQMGSSLTLDYMELIKSRPVVEKVISKAGLNMSSKELLDKLTVTNPTDTRILSINIQDKDPSEAASIANTFAAVAQKQISDIMKTDEPTIAEEAYSADEPIKPEGMKNVLVAFLLGVVLSAITIIVVYLLDDTLKKQEDVEHYLKLNILATVPMQKKEKAEKRRLKKKGGR